MTQDSTEPPMYRPGDVVNGHVLGGDGQWLPVAGAAPAPHQPFPYPHGQATAVAAGEKLRYWQRFRRRWPWCALVMAGLTILATGAQYMRADTDFVFSTLAGLMSDLVLSVFIGGVLYGLPVALLAAAFPGRVRS